MEWPHFDVLEIIASHGSASGLYLSCRRLHNDRMRASALSQVVGVSVAQIGNMLKIVDDRTGYSILAENNIDDVIRAVQSDEYISLRHVPDVADIRIIQNEAQVRACTRDWYAITRFSTRVRVDVLIAKLRAATQKNKSLEYQ